MDNSSLPTEPSLPAIPFAQNSTAPHRVRAVDVEVRGDGLWLAGVADFLSQDRVWIRLPENLPHGTHLYLSIYIDAEVPVRVEGEVERNRVGFPDEGVGPAIDVLILEGSIGDRERLESWLETHRYKDANWTRWDIAPLLIEGTGEEAA